MKIHYKKLKFSFRLFVLCLRRDFMFYYVFTPILHLKDVDIFLKYVFKLNDSKMIFVDIGGIVDNHCLKFLS
jgi:hypothetical protein